MLTIREIMEITGAKLLQGEAGGRITAISTDTRALKAGELFIALRGEKYDGHNFLAQAFEKGAAAALISQPPAAAMEGGLLQAPDTLQALGDIAAHWRRKFDIPVIAVTGSVGKTTAKEMIVSILSQTGEMLATPENHNNEIGVPLTALQLNQKHQAAVFELAMRGRGQIRHLAKIVSPTIGVITNIGLSHLELLKSPDAIAAAKAELLEVMGKKGIAVLNRDCAYYAFLKQKAARSISFGVGQGDVSAEDIHAEGEAASFNLRLPSAAILSALGIKAIAVDEALPVKLGMPGRHNIINALAAAAAALCAEAAPQQIVDGLQAFRGVAGRMRILKAKEGFAIIDDTYNASPDSMSAALKVLADMEGKRKIAILGEMRELGPNSAEFHRAIGREIARLPIALLLTVGELGKEIAFSAAGALSSAAIEPLADAPAVLQILSGRLRPGDVVLVKASRAMGLEVVVEGLLKTSQ